MEDEGTRAGREYERKGGDDADTLAGQAKDKINVGSLGYIVLHYPLLFSNLPAAQTRIRAVGQLSLLHDTLAAMIQGIAIRHAGVPEDLIIQQSGRPHVARSFWSQLRKHLR